MKILNKCNYSEIKNNLIEDSYTESMQPMIGGEKIDLRLGKDNKYYLLFYSPEFNPTVSEVFPYEIDKELWFEIHEIDADMTRLSDYSLKLLNIAKPIIENFEKGGNEK